MGLFELVCQFENILSLEPHRFLNDLIEEVTVRHDWGLWNVLLIVIKEGLFEAIIDEKLNGVVFLHYLKFNFVVQPHLIVLQITIHECFEILTLSCSSTHLTERCWSLSLFYISNNRWRTLNCVFANIVLYSFRLDEVHGLATEVLSISQISHQLGVDSFC